MRKWCFERNHVEPSDRAVNTVITHQITYARTKLKRMANKLKLPSPAAGGMQVLNAFDPSQYFVREGEEMSEQEDNSAAATAAREAAAAVASQYNNVKQETAQLEQQKQISEQQQPSTG